MAFLCKIKVENIQFGCVDIHLNLIQSLTVNVYTFRGSNFVIVIVASHKEKSLLPLEQILSFKLRPFLGRLIYIKKAISLCLLTVSRSISGQNLILVNLCHNSRQQQYE